MAEAAGFDIRRILLIGGVVLVVAFSVIFFLFRGCAPMGEVGRKPGYTLIYSNLELKDAANVIARLKELAIPYEIRDDGRAITVPKEKADQARLGLAEKNLPAGGVVGWEIFDEARLGATDFDRRIQLIRAISGELSRTIRRIEGIEDVRVQVVIPETKLFAVTTAPVTASVMIRLRPGAELAPEKINGIVHLVASSVENLQPENVIVVDDSGRILTAKAVVAPSRLAPAPPPAEMPAMLVTPEVTASPEVILKPEVAITKPAALTGEEKILLKVQAKRELEHELSGKAQELLNRFYPINSVIIKVSVEVKPAKEIEIRAKDLKIKKLYTVVLIDNRVDFTPNLKKATYTTVAAAIGYNKKRGDKIILQRVPFHLAAPPPEVKELPVKAKWQMPFISLRRLLFLGGGLLAILLVVWAVNWLRSSRGVVPEPSPTFAREKVSALDQVKAAASQNPERIAELLKRWLGE